jgi:hypothetical protein
VISTSISIPTSTSTSTSISISIYLSTYLSSIFHLSTISVSIYLSNEVLLSHKENDTMWLEVKCIELEDIMLSEVTLVQKDTGRMYYLICGR